MKQLDGQRVSRFRAVALIAGLAGLLFLGLRGPMEYPDTYGYLTGGEPNGASNRAPLYPFAAELFQLLFGNAFKHALVAFQLLFGAWAIVTLSRSISAALKLLPVPAIIVGGLLASPYFGPAIQTGNALLSEGLAYPLFLLAAHFLLDGIYRSDLKSFRLYLFMSVLLALTRPQFICLFPVAFIVLLILYLNKKLAFRSAAHLVLIGVMGIGVVSISERANNYYRHGKFTASSFTGSLLLTQALYVSKPANIAVIENVREAQAFGLAQTEASRLRVTLDSHNEVKKDLDLNTFGHYFANWLKVNGIANNAIEDAYMREGVNQSPIAEDRAKAKLAIILLRQNLDRYAFIVALNAYYGLGAHGIGDGYGIRGGYFLLLQISILLLLFSRALPPGHSESIRTCYLATLILHFANVAEMSLLIPAGDRYTFYTSTLVMAFIFALSCQGVGRLLPTTDKSTID
jgi:hypothetical protein